jgi:hypothetical protein
MEYELYPYCTRMECMVIFLICLYRMLPENKQEKNNTARTGKYALYIDLFGCGNIYFIFFEKSHDVDYFSDDTELRRQVS